MPEISSAKTPVERAVSTVARASVAARKATATVKKDRFLGALFAGGKTIVVSFAKTGYALWLQATGLICAIFAVRYGSALFHEYQANHFSDRHRFWTFAIFTVVFTWFTVLSFVKARRMMKRK